MGAVQDVDGKPLRDHLESYQAQTGRVHPRLVDAPRLPIGCEQLWQDFIDLHSARGSTGFGPARISYHDIDGFQRINGVKFEAWQIEAIRKADDTFLNHYAATHKAPGK